jgi:hypothetical protein
MHMAQMTFGANMDRKLDRLAESPPIDIDAVDFTMPDPELVRQHMGGVFQYFARVETEVSRDVSTIQALLPNMSPQLRRFVYDIWYPQEMAHGKLFDKLLANIDMTPLPVATDVKKSMAFAGHIAGLSSSVHDRLEVVYLHRGYIHESAVQIAYPIMSDRLVEIGMPGVAHTIKKGVVPQEGGHRGIYHEAATEKAKRLSARGRMEVRALSVLGYDGVGANSDANRIHYMNTNLDLVNGDESAVLDVASRLDVLAEKMLGLSDEDVAELQNRGRLDRFLMRQAINHGVFAPGFIGRKNEHYLRLVREAVADSVAAEAKVDRPTSLAIAQAA